MSARKLQMEMDRVFKRVAEGLSLFDGIYDKMQASSNQSQKEKLEQDLKRELKKLQKLRDQIKTWIGSNDVRDKKQLLENRRLIEVEMERFKAVEKEIKTKAYSREGLSAAKADPHEKEKRDTIEFLQNQIEELENQAQALESEQETLQGSMRKGKRDTDKLERIAEIEHTSDRHKWHLEKMEVMIRMIENDTLAPESVDELRDDIQYYVDSNQDVDFAEDEAIYDELNLVDDDEDEIVETIVRDDTYTLEDLAQDLDKEKAEAAKEVDEPSNPTGDVLEKDDARSGSTEAHLANTGVGAPSSGFDNKGNDAKGASASPQVALQPPPPGIPAPSSVHPVAVPAPAASVPAAANMPSTVSAASGLLNAQNCLAGLGDLLPTFEDVVRRVERPQAWATMGQQVAASLDHAPNALAADRPRNYHPETPYPTPDYYPVEPLVGIDNLAVFAKMDVDTLFYIFYYRQLTYQQFLAARELKNRSWRFHKRFLTWFQRHEEPTAINADYELGTYRFFDFEGSWLQRRKSNFKFEYSFLEDEV